MRSLHLGLTLIAISLACPAGAQNTQPFNNVNPNPATQPGISAIDSEQLRACAKPEGVLRIATFNTALSRDMPGELRETLAKPDDQKAKLVAETIQRVQPDIILLQEFDYDRSGTAIHHFATNYLTQPQNGAESIAFSHVYNPSVNTGVPVLDDKGKPLDVNLDGHTGTPADAHGWGNYPGHYGMVLLSRITLIGLWPDYHQSGVDTRPWVQTTRRVVEQAEKQDIAPRVLPEPPVRGTSKIARRYVRLPSKTNRAVLAVQTRGRTKLRNEIMLVFSHPTPPVFDGPEDRNGIRNFAEIGLMAAMADRIDASFNGREIEGQHGVSLPVIRQPTVFMGDLNADPFDGESRPGAIQQLLDHPLINTDFTPTSAGGAEWAKQQGGINAKHQGNPAADTADWGDDPERGPGNLRVDYVLPSIQLNVVGSGVFWPGPDDPLNYLNDASDHRLVWIDIKLPQDGDK